MGLMSKEQLIILAKNSSPKEGEYKKILELLDEYNLLNNSVEKNSIDLYLKLNELSKSIDIYLKKYKNSKRNNALYQLKSDLTKEVIEIKDINLKPLEKNIHFVWVGGMINNISIDYINQWKDINSDYETIIWYDSEALLVNILKKAIIDSSNKEVLTKYESVLNDNSFDSNKFYRERMEVIFRKQKEFNNYYNTNDNYTKSLNDVIKVYLIEKYLKTDEELEKYINESKEVFKANGAKDIREYDILDDVELKSIYEQELLMRFNLAAASDIIRVIVLNKLGGIYLDVDVLPGIKKHIFKDINKPTNISENKWQMIQLETIMKYKQYIKGYTENSFKNLPSDLQEILQEKVVEKNLKSDIFQRLGDIFISELDTKIAFMFGKIANQVLISKKNSYSLNLIINQIKNRYNIINKCLSSAIEKGSNFNNTVDIFIQQLNEFYVNEGFFVSKVMGYLGDGYMPDMRATLNISGPGIYTAAYYDLLYFNERSLNPQILQEDLKYFEVPQALISQQTEQEINSSWTFNQVKSQIEYKKLVEKYTNKSLSENDKLNFNENKIIDKVELLNRINSNNLINFDDKEYLRYIIQLQGDKVSYEAAINLFIKNPSNSILVQEINNISYYFNSEYKSIDSIQFDNIPEILKGKNKIKLTFIGHGEEEFNTERFASLTVKEFSKKIYKVLDIIKSNTNVKEIQIDLLGCNMFSYNINVEETYPGKLLKVVLDYVDKIYNADIKPEIKISANQYEVRINKDGKKELLSHSGEWLSKEEAIIKDIASKEIIYFDTRENTIKAESKNIMELITFRNSLDKKLNDLESLINNNFIVNEVYEQLTSNNLYRTSFRNSFLDTINFIEDISQELYEIKIKNNINDDYIISLDEIKQDNNISKIKFININSGEFRVVRENSRLINKFKEDFKFMINNLKRLIKFSDNNKLITSFELKNIESSSGVSTLNTSFLIQSMIDYKAQNFDFNKLSTSVKVQIYCQITNISLSEIQDASNLVKIIAEANEIEINLIPTLANAIPLITTIVDGINLIANIDELINTKDELIKKELAARIGVISSNMTAAISSYILYFTEFGEVFNPLLVPIAGISSGIPTLINNILILEEKSKEITEYFSHISKVESDGLFKVSDNNSILIPLDDIAISKIDFNERKVILDKLDIWAMEGGSGLSGKETFFSAPYVNENLPKLSIDNLLKIDINKIDFSIKGMMLPNGISKTLGYEFNTVDNIYELENDGVNLLNRIRDNYPGQFYWRYYSTLFNYGMVNLKINYHDTDVKINLDNADRMFIVPTLTIDQAREKLSYNFNGAGANYYIYFSSQPIKIFINGTKEDNWILNIDDIVKEVTIVNNSIVRGNFIENIFEKLTIEDNKIIIGNQKIYLKNNKTNIHFSVSILDGVNLMVEVDFNNKMYHLSLQGNEKTICNNMNIIQNNINKLFGSSSIKSIPYFYKNNGLENFIGVFSIKNNEFIYMLKDGDKNEIYKYKDNNLVCSFNLFNISYVDIISNGDKNYLKGIWNTSINNSEYKIEFLVELIDQNTIEIIKLNLSDELIKSFLTILDNLENLDVKISTIYDFLKNILFRDVFLENESLNFIVSKGFILTGNSSKNKYEFICNGENIQLYIAELYTNCTKFRNWLDNGKILVSSTDESSNNLIEYNENILSGLYSFINDIIINLDNGVEEINILLNDNSESFYKNIIINSFKNLRNEIKLKINVDYNDFKWYIKGNDIILVRKKINGFNSTILLKDTVDNNSYFNYVTLIFNDKSIKLNNIIFEMEPIIGYRD
ncbi:glycosylating toxin TpeL [Clostridium perfringens]|uniref:Monoglycosyltransferase toxin n=4 Tax=Clostridium perfringens TaxID=1502 RepID=A0A0K2Y4E9_CLOPF|nr:glycosylating toxin TpeL [Clostridium perfringens]CRG98303.1 monoglycosyltransferase toxin [Clostridium perfringens]